MSGRERFPRSRPSCPMAPDPVENPQVFGLRELQALDLAGGNVS